VKVLELFSGIGGMHFSLFGAKKVLNEIYETKNIRIPETGELRRFDFEVVAAIDISEVANKGNGGETLCDAIMKMSVQEL